jgi:hypothetical protein
MCYVQIINTRKKLLDLRSLFGLPFFEEQFPTSRTEIDDHATPTP